MGTCAPSKYYSYLQGGKPVVVVTENGSYLMEEVKKERIGYSIELGDVTALRNAIISMLENPHECAEMGKRAKTLYVQKYAYDKAMEKYASVIEEKCGITRKKVFFESDIFS